MRGRFIRPSRVPPPILLTEAKIHPFGWQAFIALRYIQDDEVRGWLSGPATATGPFSLQELQRELRPTRVRTAGGVTGR